MSYNIYDSVNKRLVNIAGSPSVFTGATASTAGTTGIVPAPAAGSQNKTLKADGTWGEGLAPTEIAYEDWMELTPEERNAGQWLVTDFPQSMNASLIPYTGDVSAANVGDAIDTLNQNLTNLMKPWRLVDELTITTSGTQYELSEDLHGKHMLLVATIPSAPTLVIGSLEIHGELGYVSGYVHLTGTFLPAGASSPILAVVSFSLIANTSKASIYTQDSGINKLKIYVKD